MNLDFFKAPKAGSEALWEINFKVPLLSPCHLHASCFPVGSWLFPSEEMF